MCSSDLTDKIHILLIIRQLRNIQIKTCALNRRIRSRAQVEVEDLEKTNLSVGINLGLKAVQ